MKTEMPRPDLVLYNGIIRTLDDHEPLASAIAIWGDRILALGTDSLAATVSSPAQAIDLDGRLVLPGFVDGHIHFAEYALRRQRVDLGEVTSLEDALARVREAARRTPEGQWILGGGWDRNVWPIPSSPDRHALDHVSQRHPIALDSKDVHTLWVNSLALQRAGIDTSTADPAGGKIQRHPDTGEPTGIISEKAKVLVTRIVEKPTAEALRQAVVEATRLVWQSGVTAIHDCEDAAAFAAFQELHLRRELGLRVLMHLTVDGLDEAIGLGIRSGLGDEWVRVGGVKLFMDGALGSRTAHMLEPYLGQPGDRGVEVTSRDELAGLLRRALGNGISVTIHAIGDAANRNVLDGLEELPCDLRSAPALPHRIEHVQLLAPEDLPRLAQLGVVASVQPLHATSDIDMVERYWGEPRGRGAYAFKSLLAAGTRLVFGTDCPVEACDPLATLHAAVTRRRPDGEPGPEGWHPAERLTLSEALRAHIVAPAYASGENRLKGTLTPGKVADMAVLSQDIVELPPQALLDTRVHATIVGGKMVYRSAEWD